MLAGLSGISQDIKAPLTLIRESALQQDKADQKVF